MVLGASDGWPAENVFEGAKHGFTFDDIVLIPGHVSFEPEDVDCSSQITRKMKLTLPLIGSPLDTVTEYELAIGLALIGSMGFIHCNQSISSQAEMVKRTKRFVSGFILEPVTLRPDHTLMDVDRIKEKMGISGVCITENGKLVSKLVGFISSRDHDTVEDRSTKIADVMVTKVIKGQEPITIEEAQDQLKRAKVGKLPIVNKDGRLITMVTRADIKKVRDFPRMSRDFHGQLLCGAKVVVGGWNNEGPQTRAGHVDRAIALAEAGADIICLDPGEASNDAQLKLVQLLKADYPKVEVIVGPVCSCREAKRIVEAGADAILAGGGLTDFGGVGRAEATALYELSKYVRSNYGIPVLAGGAIHDVGQVLKAFSLGASAVLVGEPFAGTDEAPGRNFFHEGALKKLHSAGAEPLQAMDHRVVPGGLVGSRSRHSAEVLPRGSCDAVHSRGPVRALAHYWMQGVRGGMVDLGVRTIPELHKALDDGDLRMECLPPHAAQLREVRKKALQSAPHPEVMPVPVSAAVDSSETCPVMA
mmetsp:Transcript_129749/g.361455  ORF Transcript_129749/g.361455 Transcript_129749/m.361455 type:complete len:532 (-) Transcript_129749:47-1642(-)